MERGHNGNSKVYGAILAGGAGTRMGNPDKPKQFLMLGDKPILVHTVEKFIASGLFDALMVLCPADWVDQTRDLLVHHCSFDVEAEAVHVVAGGPQRNDTIMNALLFAQETLGVDEGTVLVTHDAVRPFVTFRILQQNIQAAQDQGACDTVIPATDTIVESLDGASVSAIPDRRRLYQGQTPQSFNLLQLKALMESLTEDEKAVLTDACKIYVLRGRPVALVQGDVANMKVTYPQDLLVAAAMIGRSHA